MHPNTPERLHKFAETHRQIGAICHTMAWLEGQLEESAIELAGGSEHVRAMVAGQRAPSLCDTISRFLKTPDLVPESPWRPALAEAVSTARTLVAQRDDVVHSTWLFLAKTPPGAVSTTRSRRGGIVPGEWTADQLEELRNNLERVMDDLSTLSWNCMTPITDNLPFPWRGDPK